MNKLRNLLRPIQHFRIISIEGPRLQYGPNPHVDFLHFGNTISRTGILQGLTVVQTVDGEVFVILTTGRRQMPFVFDRVDWDS